MSGRSMKKLRKLMASPTGVKMRAAIATQDDSTIRLARATRNAGRALKRRYTSMSWKGKTMMLDQANTAVK